MDPPLRGPRHRSGWGEPGRDYPVSLTASRIAAIRAQIRCRWFFGERPCVLVPERLPDCSSAQAAVQDFDVLRAHQCGVRNPASSKMDMRAITSRTNPLL